MIHILYIQKKTIGSNSVISQWGLNLTVDKMFHRFSDYQEKSIYSVGPLFIYFRGGGGMAPFRLP